MGFSNTQQGAGASGTTFIRSIQEISANISSGTVVDVAITSVAASSSVILINGIGYSGSSPPTGAGAMIASWQLISNTTARVTRGDSTVAVTNLRATVIEFDPTVMKSRQYVDVPLVAGQNQDTASITDVNPARAMVFFSGARTTSTTAAVAQAGAAIEISTSALVLASRPGTSETTNITGYVVEFN